MENLFKLLFYLFIAVALMVVVLERFGSPMDSEVQYKWSRWILPLCGLLLVIQLFRHFF